MLGMFPGDRVSIPVPSPSPAFPSASSFLSFLKTVFETECVTQADLELAENDPELIILFLRFPSAGMAGVCYFGRRLQAFLYTTDHLGPLPHFPG